MNDPIFIFTNMVINFALLVLFLRFIMQFAEVDSGSPYMKATKRMTSVVDVFSSIFPNTGAGRISMSAIALMLLLYWINMAVNAFLLQHPIDALTLFFAGTLQAIIKFLAVLRYIILGSVVASWAIMLFNMSHPIVHLAMQLSEPIIAPFRRFVPNLGMLDLSPIVALFSLLLAEKFIGIVGANILMKM